MLKKVKSSANSPSPAAEKTMARPETLAEGEQDFDYDSDDRDAGAAETAEETAQYIADMVASLAYIARQAKLDLLTYLLDMARVEAEMQARQSETAFEDD
jgi:hypothetical protein